VVPDLLEAMEIYCGIWVPSAWELKEFMGPAPTDVLKDYTLLAEGPRAEKIDALSGCH